MICTNPDLIVDRGNKRELCAGSVAMVFEKLGGEVIYFGKPYNNVYQEAYSFLNKGDKTKEGSILCIGDGLNTDIRGANNEKLDSLLVVGGLLKNRHLIEKKTRTFVDEIKLSQTINEHKVHVDYVIKFFE